jgi:hypothetical protein
MILSEPRVRLYAETALVRKCFVVKEPQTNVLVWKNGGWQSVLLHETY